MSRIINTNHANFFVFFLILYFSCIKSSFSEKLDSFSVKNIRLSLSLSYNTLFYALTIEAHYEYIIDLHNINDKIDFMMTNASMNLRLMFFMMIIDQTVDKSWIRTFTSFFLAHWIKIRFEINLFNTRRRDMKWAKRLLKRYVIEKYSSKIIDDKRLISTKSNLIYWSEYWLFDVLSLRNIEIYLYSTIYEIKSFDVDLDSFICRLYVVFRSWCESFSRIFVWDFLLIF